MSVVAIPELIRASIAGQTDRRRDREENQGIVHHASTKLGDLLVVADGDAGGGSQGSRMAVEIISSGVASMLAFFPAEIAVEEALRQANTELIAASTSPEGGHRSMGVSVVLALLQMDTDRARVTLSHVGDGRAYLARERKLQLLTGQPGRGPEQFDGKWRKARNEELNSDRVTQTQFLGQQLDIKVATSEIDLEAGDTLLLCSAGLWRSVPEEDIERKLADQAQSVEETCRALLDLALVAAGHDHVAIEVARLTQGGEMRATVRLAVDELPIVAPLPAAELAAPPASMPAARSAVSDTDEASDRQVSFEPTRQDEQGTNELANEISVALRLQNDAEEVGSEAETGETLQAEMPLFRSFQSDGEVEGEQKSRSKWWTVASIALAIPILAVLLFLVDMARSGTPIFGHSTNQANSAANSQPQSSTQAPSHQVKVTVDQVSTGDGTQPAPARETATPPNPATTPAHAHTETTRDRSIAPAKAPQDSEKHAQENMLPPAGKDGTSGIHSAPYRDAEPAGQGGASIPVVVSADDAAKRLMESRAPIYPPAAKASCVSGTVQLAAIISEDGTVKNVRAVSGPEPLRQPAVNCVRAWRYRPFMVNNEPAEVETTINVVF